VDADEFVFTSNLMSRFHCEHISTSQRSNNIRSCVMYSRGGRNEDPPLHKPFGLPRAGFPFPKAIKSQFKCTSHGAERRLGSFHIHITFLPFGKTHGGFLGNRFTPRNVNAAIPTSSHNDADAWQNVGIRAVSGVVLKYHISKYFV